MTKTTAKKAKKYSLSEEEYQEYQRSKIALRTCDTSVMIADNNMEIIYVNEAVTAMLENREESLKTALPNFSVADLVGTNVDDFHVNPAHQRGMIADLKDPYHTDLEVAGLTFGLIATPLVDDEGQRLGTIVEWDDKTDRLALEREAAAIAQANARLKTALDACDTSVMIADPDLNIVYLNEAVQSMLSDRESALQEHLSNFDASTLMGQNVDVFHADPSHQRGMIEGLKEVYRTQITVGDLTFGLIATPIFADDGTRQGTIVEWDDMTERLAREREERAIAAANARVKQALDSVTANVMIADPNNDIIYTNDAAQEMMNTAAGDLRQELPNFDEHAIVGSNIDIYHKNPAHQQNLLAGLTDTYTADMEVGPRTFRVIANPIIEDGERLGTVVEWEDRTDEVAIEKEIDNMVEAASSGDFTMQIALDGKDGFFFNLSNGLNRLVETTEVAMNDVIRVLGSMAGGDLTQRITRDYQGSFGQLKNDVNATSDKLTEVIANIRRASTAISTGANEIAQGNTDLSQRTEEQASSLEETASSMEEMTSTVKQSAENATHANELAQNAQQTASAGGEVVSNAVAAMAEISNSSKRIADIIGVINDIAFQTNLLALNAAVEAARAGEQGRGFAVVAGEVRNLAGRSADAAKEIKDLIEDSVTKVNDGTRLVNDSGQTLEEIVEAVQKVSTMVQEISEAAIEQTAGIEQVNTAVTQMDEMTQQNAALVEEATAAGQAMAEQARGMGQMMEFFTVGDNVAEAAPTAMSAAPASNYTAPPPAAKPGNDEWEDF